MAPTKLGKLGVWTTFRRIEETAAGEAAALAEQLGYGTFWLGGSPRLPSVRPLLEATESIVVATSIVNIWTYDPAQLAAEYAKLARDYRERLLVGIGVGHPEATSDYARPFSAMRSVPGRCRRGSTPIPRERRCLAALAPKMLALSAERSLGSIPYFTPVEHTSGARASSEPARCSPPRSPSCSTPTPSAHGQPRASTRQLYLGASNYTNNLLTLGSATTTSRPAAPTG